MQANVRKQIVVENVPGHITHVTNTRMAPQIPVQIMRTVQKMRPEIEFFFGRIEKEKGEGKNFLMTHQ